MLKERSGNGERFLAPLASDENYLEMEGEGRPLTPNIFIVCGSSRIPTAGLDLIQPIRLKVPSIREGSGDKVFVQEERVKSWRCVHAIVYIGSHFQNVSFAWKEFKE